MKNFQALKELIATADADAVKIFEKGNKAAGTRLRNTMLQAKSLTQAIRKEVSDLKNTTGQ